MTFATLANSSSLFVDANTFIYHFTLHPNFASPSTKLLDRIARQEIRGFTAADVLSDVAHRVMVLEASTILGWTGGGVTKRLRQRPTEIQKLTRFQQAVQEVPRFGIQVLPITYALVEAAAALSQQFGLLSSDALIVAVMQANGLTKLAINDPDFDRVPGITRYTPT